MQTKILTMYPLLNRVVIYIFLFATGTTALVTSANLYTEYSRELNSIKRHLDTLEESQVKSLTNNLWTVNKGGLDIQLNSILQHPNIVFEEIVYPDKSVFTVGHKSLPAEKYIVKEFDLYFNDYGKKVYLGKFKVYASTENVLDYLFDKLPMIIFSNMFMVTFICGFILVLFVVLFNRHLNRIVSFTKTLDLNSLDKRLQLHREQKDENHAPDELDKIVDSINEMRLRLKDGIQQREEAELILRESEEKFRMIFTNSPLAFVHFDRHGIVKTCNNNLSKIIGSSKEELIGFDALKSINNEQMKSAISTALSGKESNFEGDYFSVTGRITTPIQATYGPLYSSDGSIIGAIGILIDISERKQAEKVMKVFKSAVTVSTDAIGMSTAEGKHYYQNEAFDQMFGNIGENPPDSVYVDQAVGHEVFQIIMAGKQWSGEVQMNGVDDRILDILLRAYPIHDENGRLINLVGVHTDITEQKHAEKSLAAEKERLAVTLRSIGDGVITTDTHGSIVLMNKVAESFTGWSNEEVIGLPLQEVFHIINEQSREVCENPVTKVVNSGQIVGLANHTILISKDGTEKSIADSGAPILDDKSNIVGVVLVFRDVTEQLRTEKELLKVKKLESIGVLAGGIAHDFNNILAAILGNINLALFDKELKDDTRKFLSEAEKASLRAKDLTQQLLTFAKGGEPVREVSSLENVIRDSANFVLHGDKVACDYDIPDDLWLVDIDKGQMSQVIQNIVLNGSHAMPVGGIINVTCENFSSINPGMLPFAKDERLVKISIQDRGIGMPSNVVEKIFDPYFSTKQEGSGLGLAISQSIISKHYGHISVESSSGVGTTFSIYLPASHKTEIHEKESALATQTHSKARILIMDDESTVRNVAKAMLVKLGHDVELSENGAEAIELFQEAASNNKKFNLIIMDLTIPGGMGGKEAAQQILELDPNTKIIVSSGYSNDPIMANFDDHGFCAAIAKPYQLQDLSKIVRKVLV